MVEFAPVTGGLFKRDFAGDTLNTSWYLRRILPQSFEVAYATRIGTDSISGEFISFLEQAAIATDCLSRDSKRTLGLYTIALRGSERHFSYWRETSAARRLADDPDELFRILEKAAVAYVSGITLAVIGERGRDNLQAVLGKQRTGGLRVAFDSNYRPKLWSSEAEARAAISTFTGLADLVLPSFDDEALLWKDNSPEATAKRLAERGAKEIVVKNGPAAAVVYKEGAVHLVSARAIPDAVDTTAAGDSFNAAYLAARCLGLAPLAACALGHELAGQVIRYHGALAPREAIEPIRTKLM